MRKTMIPLTLAALAGALALAPAAPAQTAPTPAPTPAPAAGQPRHYSVANTLVGKLLDDPAAVAVLKELIPTVYANDQFQSAGRSLPLKDIQQYEPEALSDANLAKIQAAFDKFPAKD